MTIFMYVKSRYMPQYPKQSVGQQMDLIGPAPFLIAKLIVNNRCGLHHFRPEVIERIQYGEPYFSQTANAPLWSA